MGILVGATTFVGTAVAVGSTFFVRTGVAVGVGVGVGALVAVDDASGASVGSGRLVAELMILSSSENDISLLVSSTVVAVFWRGDLFPGWGVVFLPRTKDNKRTVPTITTITPKMRLEYDSPKRVKSNAFGACLTDLLSVFFAALAGFAGLRPLVAIQFLRQ